MCSINVDLSNLPLIFSIFKSFERFWICRFFRSGFDMQVFQIWKTSWTTYLLVVWKSSGSRLDFLEVFWQSRLDFQEVVWTSRKSSGLQGSRLDFREVVWTSRKSSELHGSLLTKSPFHNRSERFGKFLCLIFLHLVTSCCIKFLLFSQTKTLQTHSNLFDLKTPNFIWIFQFCLMSFLLIYLFCRFLIRWYSSSTNLKVDLLFLDMYFCVFCKGRFI